MANENLKSALEHAGLTIEAFAEVIQVDPKSIGRWVIGDTIPYPRHRVRVASALGLSEQDLWPGSISEGADGRAGGGPAIEPGTGAVSEVDGSWAYSDDPDTPDMVALITDSDGNIDVCDARAELELSDELLAAVVEQARAGHTVRWLTSRPTIRLRALIGNPGVRVRLTEGSWHALLRAGNKMLYTVTLSFPGDQPGLLLLGHKVQGGLWDRILGEFNQVWDDPERDTPDLDTVELLEYYSETDPYDEDENDEQPADETGASARPGPASKPAAGNSAGPSQEYGQRRRWPGRTD